MGFLLKLAGLHSLRQFSQGEENAPVGVPVGDQGCWHRLI
jgi:hypothetical protein